MKEDLEKLLLSIIKKIKANNCYMEMSEEKLYNSISKSLEIEYKKMIKIIDKKLSKKVENENISEEELNFEYEKEYSELEKALVYKTYSISAMNKAEVDYLKNFI